MLNIRQFLKGLRILPKSVSEIDAQGEFEVLTTDGKTHYHDGTVVSPVVTEVSVVDNLENKNQITSEPGTSFTAESDTSVILKDGTTTLTVDSPNVNASVGTSGVLSINNELKLSSTNSPSRNLITGTTKRIDIISPTDTDVRISSPGTGSVLIAGGAYAEIVGGIDGLGVLNSAGEISVSTTQDGDNITLESAGDIRLEVEDTHVAVMSAADTLGSNDATSVATFKDSVYISAGHINSPAELSITDDGQTADITMTSLQGDLVLETAAPTTNPVSVQGVNFIDSGTETILTPPVTNSINVELAATKVVSINNDLILNPSNATFSNAATVTSSGKALSIAADTGNQTTVLSQSAPLVLAGLGSGSVTVLTATGTVNLTSGGAVNISSDNGGDITISPNSTGHTIVDPSLAFPFQADPGTGPTGLSEHSIIYVGDDKNLYLKDDEDNVKNLSLYAPNAITALTGDVAANGPGSVTATIQGDAVTNTKLANMAQSTIKGRAVSAGTGDPQDLTATQATAILDVMVGDSGSGGTKGLVPAPAAGDTAANKFLKANGTWVDPSTSLGAGFINALTTVTPADNDFAAIADASDSNNAKKALISGIKTLTVQTKTSTYTALNTDDVILVSGGTFDIDLPAASTCYKPLRIIKTDTSLANIITIDPDSAETISKDGTTYSTVTLNTVNESWLLYPGSGTWYVFEHKTDTGWIDFPSLTAGGTNASPGSNLITATTTAPTYGTIVSHYARWRRVGDSAIIDWFFRSSTNGTTGNGNYLFNLPSGLSVDTSKIAANTSFSLANTSHDSNLGRFAWNTGTETVVNGTLELYSATQFKAFTTTNSGAGHATQVWSDDSANVSFASTSPRGFTTKPLPISGWFN